MEAGGAPPMSALWQAGLVVTRALEKVRPIESPRFITRESCDRHETASHLRNYLKTRGRPQTVIPAKAGIQRIKQLFGQCPLKVVVLR